MYEKLLERIVLENKIPFNILNILFKHSLIKFNGKPFLTKKGKLVLETYRERLIIESEIRKITGKININKQFKYNFHKYLKVITMRF